MRAAHSADGRLVIGDRHHRHVRSRLGHVARWAILCEDLPDDANRVVLPPGATKAPASRSHESSTARRRTAGETSAFQIERATESLQEAGSTDVEVHSLLPNGHLMGTARMGDDRDNSVVDRWGMAHDVPNLGIVDGSVFVTAGSANPTSTIAALALRTAEHLIEQRRDLPIPSPARRIAGFAPVTRLQTSSTKRLRAPLTVTERQRERFAAIAGRVIPGDATMPDAGRVVRTGAYVERLLDARPDLATPLLALLDNDEDDPAALLAALDPPGRRVLEYSVVGAYYLDREVLAQLECDDTPRPVPPFAYPAYLDEGLLDHLLDTLH